MQILGLHKKQKEITSNILHSEDKFHIINASRQSGKSYGISYLALLFGILDENTNEDILVVSPTYDQSSIIYDNILNIKNVHHLIYKTKDSKPNQIIFKNNCRVSFKSAERANNIRGGSYKVVILDEFSYFKPGILEAIIRPTTAAKQNSKIIISSTPKGLNEFKELYDNYTSYFMHYTDNPYYDLSEVEDAKKRLPTNIFNQEYEGMFIEDGGDVFDSFADVQTVTSYNIPYKRLFAGIDWGKANDKTVLHILNENKESVFTKSYEGNRWDSIMNDLVNNLNHYRPIIYAESNGVGDPMIEDLKKRYKGIVHHFTMSNSSKREIIEDLRMTIEQKEISLPTKELNPELNLQLANYTYSMTKLGLITYHHRDGFHDDEVDALAIANYAYKKHNKQFIAY